MNTEDLVETLEFTGPPTTIQQLEQRVSAIAGKLGVPAQRVRVLVCSIVVSQMLPEDTVIKGGIGIKVRLGEIGTRATGDIDIVTRDEKGFLISLQERLKAGWGTVPPSKGQLRKDPEAPPRLAFTGQAKAGKKPTPAGVPAGYVMQPYKVTVSFIGSAWASVRLEVAHDEIDGIEFADYHHDVADQLAAIASVLGFGDLAPVPLISLEQQIAQKLHAATEPGSARAHDLVDLQLLWSAGTDGGEHLDLSLLKTVCERTFTYRRQHTWPPTTVAMPALLSEAYRAALEEARTAPNLVGDIQAVDGAGSVAPLADQLDDATAWLSDRIAQIVEIQP